MKRFHVITWTLTALLVLVTGLTLSVDMINAQGTVYKIGDRGPGGGWIFYDKGFYSNGWRYMEAAPDDLDIFNYGCSGISIPGARGTKIGDGKKNTQAILKACSDPESAAQKCSVYSAGGKNDWFIPSKDELDLMHKNLFKKGITDCNFKHGSYLSSSTIKENFVYMQQFGVMMGSLAFDGVQSDTNRSFGGLNVRPIRSF